MNSTKKYLGYKDECLSIPICIDINDEGVEMSKNLDRYSIIDMISKYNQDLASEKKKINFYVIQHPKSKKKLKIKFHHLWKLLIIMINI